MCLKNVFHVQYDNGDRMKTRSIWEDTTSRTKDVQKQTSIVTDVLIIGGGMAGMSAAFHLQDAGKNIVLIDKGTIGMGVTSRTTGKLTFLQELIYQKISRAYNKSTSRLYLDSQREAIKIVKDIVSENKIECALTKVPSYIFTEQEKDILKLEKEKKILEEFGIACEMLDALPFPYPSVQALKVDDTYVFHPLDYLRSLQSIVIRKGVAIYEHICAREIKKENDIYIVETDKGIITAKQVIVTTHYPFFVSPGFIPLKSHIEKSYILAAKWDSARPISAITIGKPTVSLRFYKDFLLYGGQSHKTSNHLHAKDRYDELIQDYQKQWKEYPMISYIWSTHDVITEDGMPYIGKASKDDDCLFLATGFNKWGMTNGSLAGKILADMVLGKANPYTDLFRVDRSYNFTRLKAFMVNGMNTGKVFVQTKLNRNPSFYKDHVKVYKKDGIYYGSYLDEKGVEHIVRNTCPHMGCSLLFNEYDITWDCPCHGSRFDIDGKIIEGPSCYSIEVSKKDA